MLLNELFLVQRISWNVYIVPNAQMREHVQFYGELHKKFLLKTRRTSGKYCESFLIRTFFVFVCVDYYECSQRIPLTFVQWPSFSDVNKKKIYFCSSTKIVRFPLDNNVYEVKNWNKFLSETKGSDYFSTENHQIGRTIHIQRKRQKIGLKTFAAATTQ